MYGIAKNIDALKGFVVVAMGGIEPPTSASRRYVLECSCLPMI